MPQVATQPPAAFLPEAGITPCDGMRLRSHLGSLLSQADAVLPSHSREVLPTVQRHENGPRAPGAPFCDWEAECKRTGLCRVRHLQRRAGKAPVTGLQMKDKTGFGVWSSCGCCVSPSCRPTQSTSSPTRSLNPKAQRSLPPEPSRSPNYSKRLFHCSAHFHKTCGDDTFSLFHQLHVSTEACPAS